MDIKPSIDSKVLHDPENTKVLNFAAFIPNSKEYSTRLVHFPGANSSWRWDTEGCSFMSLTFYSPDGKPLLKYHSTYETVNGHFDISFDDILSVYPEPFCGVVMMEFHHPRRIPADVYLSHVHKSTGNYVAYPPSPFSGDTIFVRAHETELDNTLFWPGVVENQSAETHVMVINPFKVPFSYQLSLYLQNGQRVQSKVRKIRPMRVDDVSISECFSEYKHELENSHEGISLCVAAQYKVNAYVVFKDKQTGAYTTIDHLHRYSFT